MDGVRIETARLEIASVSERDRPEDLMPVFNSNPEFIAASEGFTGKTTYDLSDVEMYLYQETSREHSTCLAIRLRDGGALIGTACFVAPHPEGDFPWLGLLLLDAASQGRGLGAEAAAALEDLLARRGWRELRLSVLVANPRGRAFWERRGYEVIGEQTDQDARPVWVLRKPLHAEPD